jgi:hypothetical protein
MKKMLAILVCGLAFCASTQSNAQTNNQDETILVRKSDLPAEVVQQLQSKQQLAEMSQKLETYGKWVGIGKELGTAVNESMSALTTQADKFSKTDVGKFTMFMVAYKVLGNDAIALVKRLIMIPIGIVVLIVGTWTCIRSLRIMCWGYSVLEKVDPDKTKHYKFIGPTEESGENRSGVTFVHGVCYVIFLAFMFWIFFS